jgi:hypothetical protein
VARNKVPYVFSSNQSLIGYYLFPDVLKLDYIYSSQLSSKFKDTVTRVLSIALLRRMESEVRLRTFLTSALKGNELQVPAILLRGKSSLYVSVLHRTLDGLGGQSRNTGNENNSCRNMNVDGPFWSAQTYYCCVNSGIRKSRHFHSLPKSCSPIDAYYYFEMR